MIGVTAGAVDCGRAARPVRRSSAQASGRVGGSIFWCAQNRSPDRSTLCSTGRGDGSDVGDTGNIGGLVVISTSMSFVGATNALGATSAGDILAKHERSVKRHPELVVIIVRRSNASKRHCMAK